MLKGDHYDIRVDNFFSLATSKPRRASRAIFCESAALVAARTGKAEALKFPKPYTLNPTPQTPKPYTLHPQPQTLHPIYTVNPEP